MMTTFSRRQFLAAGSAATAICLAGRTAAAEATAFPRRNDILIGLNGTVVADALEKKLDQTLQAVAQIGYRLIEFPGFVQKSGKALRRAVDQAGLRCDSVYVYTATSGIPRGLDFSLDGDLDRLAEQAHFLGVKYIVLPVPFISNRFSFQPQHGETRIQRQVDIIHQLTRDDWKAAASYLNHRGAALKRRGLQLAYHNHNIEFVQVADGTGYDVLLADTDPDLVSFEMDAGWVASSGHDPLALLQSHPGRFRMMSVKDFAATTPRNTSLDIHLTAIGDGIVDWKRLLPAAHAAGIRDFYVDLDPPFDRPLMEVLRRSFEYLDRLNV